MNFDPAKLPKEPDSVYISPIWLNHSDHSSNSGSSSFNISERTSTSSNISPLPNTNSFLHSEETPITNEALSHSLLHQEELSRYPSFFCNPNNGINSSASSREGFKGSDYAQSIINPSLFGHFDANWIYRCKEEDDDIHNPNFSVLSVDQYKKSLGWSRWGDIISLLLLLLGFILLFIIFPALTYTGNVSPKKEHNPAMAEQVTDHLFGLLRFPRTDLVDPDTPDSALTKVGVNGKNYKLMFSDEFNKPGRSFYPGDDQFWEASDLHYAATNDLEWYDPDAITTVNGTLDIKLESFANHNLNFRSGMLQSWNKLCWKGGIIEISASLGGSGEHAGLWPGLWTIGNLARPGYMATTEGVWPYSYSQCDAGITPNQSSWDGISYLPGQKLSSCTCDGEDHPSLGVGRGAPEIDALEGSTEKLNPDDELDVGSASQSSQFAPFDLFYLPNYDYLVIHNQSVTHMNSYVGGPFQQALSGITILNNSWYERRAFQTYGFDYKPGEADGYVSWFVGPNHTWTMLGAAVGPNGNVGARQISEEPMSIVFNLGISNNWAYYYFRDLHMPATMSIDFIRIYQDPEDDNMHIGCDPPGYPTTEYIANHPIAYKNANKTSWEMTGYEWPKNSLMHGCSV
ncbi:plasma membrane beta-glucan biosynthesis protein [Schizosaccharomyces osmophilus]|uniref:Plasma membrane beta-glucan biosynthesis protein n=1 Tax=Schizosaccharomyces osmophilus TaxID=2545709 RepID=A0AAE9WD20_9SCHI|nr:plasma membrane beta-glucan biosynthesis protein [Schizosaccharomyces osmophilus]WBW74182.1 plasma membrane beta-glucan biosynthesis protein [Schizosaccharomyces osmophilus]